MSLPIPKQVPKLGFYYHYKHDPQGPYNEYVYEVIGVGFHTEDDARPGEEHFVLYRPLYGSSVYIVAQELQVPCLDARPLEMWMSKVGKEGQQVPRFRPINDPGVIVRLMTLRAKMYPE